MAITLLDSYVVQRQAPANYINGELDFCIEEFLYETNNVVLTDLRDCVVKKNGFVYETKKFRLNESSLIDKRLYPNELSIKSYFKNVLFKKKRCLKYEKYLLVHDDWTNNYYHWFCDLLPKLFLIKDCLKDYILILPDTPFVQNIGLKSLAFFKLFPSDFEFISTREFVKIKKLSVINLTCRTGRINDILLGKMRNYINNTLNEVPDKKLYITRESAQSRILLNEASVKDIVKDFGYEVMKYEDLQWEDQIKITSQAKSIVSMHGAGLTNMLFMPKSASVLEFRRNKIYHNQCYWHLAASINLKYFYLFGTPDNEDLQLEGSGCNLTIDINKLAKALAQIETS